MICNECTVYLAEYIIAKHHLQNGELALNNCIKGNFASSQKEMSFCQYKYICRWGKSFDKKKKLENRIKDPFHRHTSKLLSFNPMVTENHVPHPGLEIHRVHTLHTLDQDNCSMYNKLTMLSNYLENLPWRHYETYWPNYRFSHRMKLLSERSQSIMLLSLTI